jgi:protein-tyrosine phosphatase
MWTGKINDYDQIIPYLYIGNINALDNHDKFGFIVNCTKDIPFSKDCTSCIRIPVNDDPNESEKLLDMIIRYSIMEKMNQFITMKIPVLVHCKAGMQRSCAVVACYLMKYYNITPMVAMEHVKKYRMMAFFGGANFLTTIQQQYAGTGV